MANLIGALFADPEFREIHKVGVEKPEPGNFFDSQAAKDLDDMCNHEFLGEYVGKNLCFEVG
eukprot:85500-Chlamydomonas_euryale.AAC.1